MAELSRDDVIEHVRDRVSLEHADLSALDLRGIDFRRVNLSGANLSNCRLSGSQFVETNMSRAKLYEADLSGSNLGGANLNGAVLQKANLSESNLANAKMEKASFRQADLTNADLTNSDLAGADFHFAKCARTDFRRAVLAGANFTRTFLQGAMFRGADVREAVFEGAIGVDPAVLKGDTGPSIELQTPAKSSLLDMALGVKGAKGRVDYGVARNKEQPVEAPAPKTAKRSKYHPPLRSLQAVIFTTGGWIRGVFHVPVMHGFLEHINLSGEMLKLTNVLLPYLSLELQFFGLRRNKALLVVPNCDVALLKLPEPTADYHVHRVSFLIEGGTVTGSLAIEEDIRVSDYLANHDQFLVLRNCRFGAHDAPVEEESHFPVLLVNCRTVIGASDTRLRN